MSTYDQASVVYVGPSGRVWQLQGKGQLAQPVTLLPSPDGFFGPEITVNRRSSLRDRKTVRTSVKPEPINIELMVDIRALTPSDMARTLRHFLNDWPEDLEEGTGRLGVISSAGKWHYMDVYRTEKVQFLSRKDPMVELKGRYLIVASSDDPYPYGDYEVKIAKLVAGVKATLEARNEGQVTTSPTIYWGGGASTLTISAPAQDRLPALNISVPVAEPSLINLDPRKITVTDSTGSRPIEARWDTNPHLDVPPSMMRPVAVTSTTNGEVQLHLVPVFRRLYG